MKKVLTFSGSVREGSLNGMLQAYVDKRLAAAGFEVTHINLADYEMPIYHDNMIDEAAPDASERLAELIRAQDAVFISTPEYNGTIPPILNNMITWLSTHRPSVFQGRVWGIAGVSTGKYGATSALGHLRDILSKMGGVVAPGLIGIGPAEQSFNREGEPIEPQILKKIDAMIDCFEKISLR